MVKSCVNFRNSLFIYVHLKEVCFLGGCFYLVFTKNFGNYWYPCAFNKFKKKLFYQNLFSLLWNAAHLFLLQTYIFSKLLNFLLLKQLLLLSISYEHTNKLWFIFHQIMLMGLIRQKSELKSLNTLWRKSQIMECYSYKKLILLMKMSSTGSAILIVLFFFFNWEHKFRLFHHWIFGWQKKS